jgi:hypothetical protein
MPTYPTNHYAEPATYITQIDGKFYVIHYGSPVSEGMATITDALAAAVELDLTVSPDVWQRT